VYNFVTHLENKRVCLLDTTLVLLAAGNSSRFRLPVKKQWLRIDHDPLWHFVTEKLFSSEKFAKVIITAHADEVTFMHNYTNHLVIAGGQTRQESLSKALDHVNTPYVLISDIARACVDMELLNNIIENRHQADCIVPYLSVSDTVVYNNETINRDNIKRIQTPQLSKVAVLKKALSSNETFTDESSAIVASGGSRYFVKGSQDADKITHISDLNKLPCLAAPASTTFVGNGFDVHAFEANSVMMLGGIEIDSVDYGFKAHSDGDVAIHALIDALLGAAGLGDIGMLFPDSDASFQNIDSKILLTACVKQLHHLGYEVMNADLTIAAEAPRLSAYKDAMRSTLAPLLHIPKARMNIKATTTEKLGFIGRKEGVGVMASATLNYFDWTK